MNWYTYDTEVFAYDFIVVFKNRDTGEYAVFHNDNLGVRNFINEYSVYCGCNSKGYDQYIIKAICNGLSPEEVKQVNDWIIGGGQGWQSPLLDGIYYRFNNIDIKDDVQMGLSLKAIEGHLGMSVEESDVSFDLDRPLTPEEVEQVVKYCKHDVDAAEKLTEVRKDYLQTKLNLGKRADISPVEALAMTNAKLTAKMLRAERKVWNDGRDYVYPPNLDLSLIPQDVIAFFDTIYDKAISDEELFKTSLTTEIGGMPCKFAWGGVHGSVTGYHEQATDTRVIQNRDVSSLYPSLIEGYNYLSRNVPDPQLFYSIRKERIEAKHKGDKQTANDLKLPLNTVSGAQENKYNDLYDPLPTRSLRISGQLFLTMLTVQLLEACKTIRLLNLNTDGLMYSIDKEELPIADRISAEWEKTTGFELEVDDIDKVWIKDVNNLLLIKTDGSVKTVGGYLNYGISVKGAWAINNNMVIVKKALIEYFVHGTPVEETINNSTDLFDFQLIAKAGVKYKEAYHIVDGVKHSVQKVNRVYATADERYGKLFKVKAENDATAKIEMLPEHCIIDNDNRVTIDDIDKSFYIEVARKRINDYLGINNKRRTQPMATTTTTKTEKKTMNVYGKLLAARAQFLKSGAKKTGKNMHLAFKYFELDDIVPIATEIFTNVGLIAITGFTADTATLTIVNTDNPEEQIPFVAPFNQIAPIVSSSGKQATNEMQALGSSITYMRRYLYMIALDICEPDEIDAGLTNTPKQTESAPAPVAMPKAEPKAAPQEKPLTSADGNASELQIGQLKELLKKVLEIDPSQEERIAEIAVASKGFTVISRAECEALVKFFTEHLNKEDK